jgi:hypothetical protein
MMTRWMSNLPKRSGDARKFAASGRYSGWRLLLEGFTGQRGWSHAWSKAAPHPGYRVVIVGGGGHGLATAYYLAAEFGITDVAVLERGPIGLGKNCGKDSRRPSISIRWSVSEEP